MKNYNNTLFYLKSFLQYGISPKALHWSSKITQLSRFDALVYFIKDDIKNSTIVDAGCGFGDLYFYLEFQELLPKKYIGIEKEIFFYLIAKDRTKQTIYCKDILKDELIEADYYISSGSLNLLDLKKVELFINRCFLYSKKGFIFNFLSKNQFVKINKDEILQICGNITKKIEILDDYLDNDYTIFLKR